MIVDTPPDEISSSYDTTPHDHSEQIVFSVPAPVPSMNSTAHNAAGHVSSIVQIVTISPSHPQDL